MIVPIGERKRQPADEREIMPGSKGKTPCRSCLTGDCRAWLPSRGFSRLSLYTPSVFAAVRLVCRVTEAFEDKLLMQGAGWIFGDDECASYLKLQLFRQRPPSACSPTGLNARVLSVRLLDSSVGDLSLLCWRAHFGEHTPLFRTLPAS